MLPEGYPGMGTFLKTVTRWMKGPILLFGIYIILYGHVAPGGGFGGGVVIASAFVLMTLAYGESYTLEFFSRIKEEYPNSAQANGVDAFIGMAQTAD